jgi:hypothetical protein
MDKKWLKVGGKTQNEKCKMKSAKCKMKNICAAVLRCYSAAVY